MSGLPDMNYPEFNRVAALLRAKGYDVFNPAENPEPPCKSWQGYMRLGIAQLVQCDGVALLPNWRKSEGARLEVNIARELDIPFFSVKVALEAQCSPQELIGHFQEFSKNFINC
jgi:hypothetical protein